MPRLLNAETDLKEIESILLKSHWLDSFRKRKIVNNVEDSNFVIHGNADGFITIYSTFNEPHFKRKKAFREGGGCYMFIK